MLASGGHLAKSPVHLWQKAVHKAGLLEGAASSGDTASAGASTGATRAETVEVNMEMAPWVQL